MAILAGTILCASPIKADPLTVSYTTQQVSGSTWQYQYQLSGTMNQGDDLVILFPFGTTASLVDQTSASADITSFVLQPDATLGADGELDLLANITNPDLFTYFQVSFLYSGSGSPGAQAFTLYDSSFNPVSSGDTAPVTPTAATPEVSSVVLLATGMFAMLGVSRQRFGL
ncbi:hypothetical protein [Terriglobus sp.]|uniref:hypothetical protein n=1 Tax=Terriglobus sp. TaxID=1889013 RepID=UPI003B00FA0D